MAYVELDLTEEVEKLGVSKIACNEGVFVIIWLEKEYAYAFPTETWDRNQQATLEYLYDQIVNGVGTSHGPITEEAAISISNTVKQESNWELVEQHVNTLAEKTSSETIPIPIPIARSPDAAITEEDREQELVNTPVTEEDINFVFETLYKEAPYDKISIKQLIYGMFSAFTKTGIPHNVNSKDSGAGKNYLLEICSRVFPDKYVEQFVGVSDKAFVHRRGQLVIEDKATGELTFIQPMIKQLDQKLDDITDELAVAKCAPAKTRDYEKIGKLTVEQNKITRQIRDLRSKAQKYFSLGDLIIIISDTPQEGFLATIMSLSSQDTKRRQRYIFTDKTSSGRQEASTNIIDGQPVVFSAQVIDTSDSKRHAEITRRSINVTPNTSTGKISEAIKLMGNQAGLLPEEYDEQVVSRKDQQKAARTVAAIVEKLRNHSQYFEPKTYGVKIPFLKAIVNSIPKDSVWTMTVMHRIRAYLAVVTKVHMDNRPRLVNTRTGAFYPIATFKDLQETWELMERGGSNVRTHLAQCYNEVIYPTFINTVGAAPEIKGLTSEEIAEAIHEKLKIPQPSIRDVYNTYLKPLSNLGLLSYTKNEDNKNENLWYPADLEVSNVFSLFKDSVLKLTITDANAFPSANVLEEEYGFLRSTGAGEGWINSENFYRLQEVDGTEITVQQMINKHFQDAESCFEKGFL